MVRVEDTTGSAPDEPSESHPGPGLSAESLRWAIGLFCAFIGAFVLVAPHRFAGPAYQALLPIRAWWGVAALGGGVALLSVAVLRPGRAATAAAHLLAGGTLLILATSLSRTEIWTGFVFHLILGTGTVVAGLLVPVKPAPRAPAADLFALLMGAIAALSGALMVIAPRTFGPYFDVRRNWLPMLGAVLVIGGSLLAVGHLRSTPSRRLLWAGHLVTGAAFVAYGFAFSLPRRSWTGLASSVGCGVGLALLPWLSARLGRIDTAALRTRLALVLAAATSLSLILTAAVATTQEERLAVDQVIETHRVEAASVAQNVADYVRLTAARTATIAAVATRVPPNPEAQHAFLDRTLRIYPDLEALVRLDPFGRVMAARGEIPLDAIRWRELAAGARSDSRVAVDLLVLPGKTRPRILLTSPVTGLDNRSFGVVVSSLDADAVAQRIERRGSNVYLADGYGRAIAQREMAPLGTGAKLPADWDVRIRLGRPVPRADRLAAYARVPNIGWVVAVERPRRAALAGVQQGRDMAFLLLLAVVPLAVALGIFGARRIARPLGTLADAVSQMTAGNPAAPLGRSDIAEVARLSAAFAEMRGRLAERTRESERLAAELRARAEALAESDRRKDEFLAMLAHELRNPLGAIANAAYLLDQAGPLDETQRRGVGIIQRQIQHLVRLVDDLLDVSRITRGKVELRREPVDLRQVVKHAVETSRPLIESRQHQVRVSLPQEPLRIEGDVTRLEQVAGNLLRNAAKYTDPGGRIEVEAFSQEGEAVLVVRDNGKGISPDLLPRIFDLFVQGEQGLDRSGAGLGIGLTLVRRLVEMHGGRVLARSEGEGKGSELEVRLPVLAPQPLLNAAPPAPV